MNHGSDGGRRGPGPIPPRWLHCPRKAQGLLEGRFLAFKTPLGPQFDSQVPIENRFPPSMIFDSMKSYKVQIGMWIDLTNTSRFYDRTEVESKDCKYVKLPMLGHSECPSEDQSRAFVGLCQRFVSLHPTAAIGVHCTHGFNRTGFLLTCYLVEELCWSVEMSLTHFAQLRPPGIYKLHYIQELYRRYNEGTGPTHGPELPDWHRESDDSVDADGDDDGNDGEEDEDEPNGGPNNHGLKRKKGLGAPQGRKKMKKGNFMEGVPGVLPLEGDLVLRVQQKIRRMCEPCGWGREKGQKRGFPGSQPVSMDQQNLNLLAERPYQVSWKADGTRYMMLIDLRDPKAEKPSESGPLGGVFFVDRDECVFQVSGLSFPCRSDPSKCIADTLLDGEMVIDKVGEEKFPRYLVYDIIQYQGLNVGATDFSRRMLCIKKEIIGPRRQAIQDGRIDKSLEPFGVREKEFWDVLQARSLLGEKFKQQLLHEPDGLVFQPVMDPYKAGRCDIVLKWKPASMNSVDFRLKIVKETRQGMPNTKVGHLYVGSMESPFAEMRVTKSVSGMDNKIVECMFDGRNWKFMRQRTDKSFPNSYTTAMAVCNSIRHPVTQDMLLDFIDNNRWKKPPAALPSKSGAPVRPSSSGSQVPMGPPPAPLRK